jgi:hypothetical protein
MQHQVCHRKRCPAGLHCVPHLDLVGLFPVGGGLGWIDRNLILHKLVMKLFYLNPAQSNLI